MALRAYQLIVLIKFGKQAYPALLIHTMQLRCMHNNAAGVNLRLVLHLCETNAIACLSILMQLPKNSFWFVLNGHARCFCLVLLKFLVVVQVYQFVFGRQKK